MSEPLLPESNNVNQPERPAAPQVPASVDPAIAVTQAETIASNQQVQVHIDLEYDPRVNYAMQQNDVPIVKLLRIRNGSDVALTDLSIRVWIDHDLAQPWIRTIAFLAPGEAFSFDPVMLPLDADVLVRQTERQRATLYIQIGLPVDLPANSSADEPIETKTETETETGVSGADTIGDQERGETIIAQREEPIDILAYNEWGGVQSLPEILAAFVLPNHPAIDGILTRTCEHLKQTTGDPSLSGYQRKDAQRIRAIVAAIYQAVHDCNINYVNPPASYETHGQKVRLPDQILEHRLGTCFDLALLLASCMEQAGLNPLVLLTQGHAFTACWLEDDTFAEPAVDDVLRIVKRVQLDQIMVVEATAATTSPTDARSMSIDDAQQAALQQLSDRDDFVCAIDVRCARKLRIMPLPYRVAVGEYEIVDPAEVGFDQSDISGSDVAATSEILSTPAGKNELNLDGAIKESSWQRLDRWKRRLLDLTGRNRLINHRDSKKTIPVLCPDVAELEDALAQGSTFAIKPRPAVMEQEHPRSNEAHMQRTGENVVEQFLHDELHAKRLYTHLTENELDKRLVEVYRASRLSLEESGANTLYMAIGFLSWCETNSASAPMRRAPIVLLPLKLERASVRSDYKISLADDDARINVTLLEKLKVEFGLEVQGLDVLPEDDTGVDIPLLLRRFRELVIDINRWEVTQEASVGLFSFTKFLMWHDLQERSDQLMENAVVQHLVQRPDQPFDGSSADNMAPFPDAASLDDTHHPAMTFCPMDADSSQLTAVFAGQAGHSFVLEGPPGTGKSQTITNLIAQCVSDGKRVLFVSEKMAALNVVHKRLEQVGLGPFCLELHSNKANKKQVLSQLERALHFSSTNQPTHWQAASDEVEQARSQLNHLVEQLHESQSIGQSVFDVTAELIALRNIEPVRFDQVWINSLDEDKLYEIEQQINQLATAANVVFPVATHVMQGICRRSWQTTLPDDLAFGVEQMLPVIDELAKAIDHVVRELGLTNEDNTATPSNASDVLSKIAIKWLNDMAKLLMEPVLATEPLLTEPGFADLKQSLMDVIAQGKRRDQMRKQITSRYQAELLDQNLDELLAQLRKAMAGFPLLSWFTKWKLRKAIKTFTIQNKLPDNKQLESDLELAIELRGLNQALTGANHIGAQFFGARWNASEADWQVLESILDWTCRFRNLILEAGASPFVQLQGDSHNAFRDRCVTWAVAQRDRCNRGAALGDALVTFIEARDALMQSLEQCNQLLDVNETEAFGPDEKESYLNSITSRVSGWNVNRLKLNDWLFWQRTRSESVQAGLEPLIEALENKTGITDEHNSEQPCLRPEQLRDLFRRSILHQWLNNVTDASEALREFNSTEHHGRIERFCDQDRAHMALASRMLSAAISAKLPSNQGQSAASAASEMGILQRQFKLQRRHMPVRKLISKLPNLLPMLKPCLLMSPLSVAQYLDPKVPPFDVVVFDEASQIPVWDSVGAIARGKSAIVVGDSKQLPPTTFFMKVNDEDESLDEDDFEEVESILDECSAAGLRSLRLQWHYRSRHESLITFSNYHYYQNELQTFPSPKLRSETMGVSTRFFDDGIYDKGKTRTNQREAEAVVAEIVRRLKQGQDYDQHSIGVVTFSIPQQVLIEDLLDQARAQNPEIDTYFTDAVEEPVFIKNLENVQGDERDVILFSICYGPDQSGRVSMNFGPLNREGGERRLNVAITRARQQVIVFTSLRAEKIDLSRTRAQGVKHLKAFLDYAHRGPDALAHATTLPREIDQSALLASAIANALESRMWEAQCNVGCSGYRVDVAIRHPDQADAFLLGITLDGHYYSNANNARDRDRTRQSVLKNLGWNLHRVWSSDWWRDPQREIDRIEQAIQAALKSTRSGGQEQDEITDGDVDDDLVSDRSSGELPSADTDPFAHLIEESALASDSATGPHSSQASQVAGLRTYKIVSPKKIYGDSDDFYLPASRRKVRDVLLRVMQHEAPIQFGLAVRRVIAFWDFARVTDRARSAVEEIRNLIPVVDRPELIDGYLWHAGQTPETYETFRIPRDGESEPPRGVEEIPAIEIANAARAVLIHQIAMPVQDLARETAKLLGFGRVTDNIAGYMLAGIEILKQMDRCVIENEQVRLP